MSAGNGLAGANAFRVLAKEARHVGNDLEPDVIVGGDARSHYQDGSDVGVGDGGAAGGVLRARRDIDDGKIAGDGNGCGFIVQRHDAGGGDHLRVGGLIQERENCFDAVGRQEADVRQQAAGSACRKAAVADCAVSTWWRCSNPEWWWWRYDDSARTSSAGSGHRRAGRRCG